MTNYIIIHAQYPKNPNSVLLILKNKPDYLKGKLNLVGGKIEDGETPEQAAFRELREEAGITASSGPILYGKITSSDWTVYCLKCEIYNADINQGEGETEQVSWHDWMTVQNDPRLIPNLKIIIPLLMMEVKGWEIKDSGSANEMSIKF